MTLGRVRVEGLLTVWEMAADYSNRVYEDMVEGGNGGNFEGEYSRPCGFDP